jgi:hypothetical protein
MAQGAQPSRKHRLDILDFPLSRPSGQGTFLFYLLRLQPPRCRTTPKRSKHASPHTFPRFRTAACWSYGGVQHAPPIPSRCNQPWPLLWALLRCFVVVWRCDLVSGGSGNGVPWCSTCSSGVVVMPKECKTCRSSVGVMTFAHTMRA